LEGGLVTDSFELMPDHRYTRHEMIDWWDQDRLGQAQVLVVGAGAVGNEVLKNLALVGVGNIIIVDFDKVEVTNLSRSVLFREEDLGRPKAEVAAEAARRIHPGLRIRTIEGDLEYALGLGTVRDVDAVLACLDSLYGRLALNRLCGRAGTPWINAGISDVAAEVAVFHHPISACYECGVGAAAAEELGRRFSCGGLRNPIGERRVPTTATTASLAGSLAVNELLHLLHAEDPSSKEGLRPGQRLYVSLKAPEMSVAELMRHECCPWHDSVPEPKRLDLGAESSARAVAEAAGLEDGEVNLPWELVTEVRCNGCGQLSMVMKPAGRCGVELLDCERCGPSSKSAVRLSRIEARSEIYDRPLASLGVPDGEILVISARGRHAHAQLKTEVSRRC
jgi:molybdopterin/thiamine biosynthesis adenylyltransferase